MIDYPTYQALHPESGDRWDLVPECKVDSTFIEQEALSEPDIYLLPRTILGFNLRRKKWGAYSRISQKLVVLLLKILSSRGPQR